MLPTRRMQRGIKGLLLCGVFLSLLVLIVLNLCPSSHEPSSSPVNEDAHFYDSDILDDSLPKDHNPSVMHTDKKYEYRTRVMNTSEGVVVVKDFLFVPRKRLPRGINLYMFKKMKSLISNSSELDINNLKDTNIEGKTFNKGNALNKFFEENREKNAAQILAVRHAEVDSYRDVDKMTLNTMPKSRQFHNPSHQLIPHSKTKINNVECISSPCKGYLSRADILYFKYCRKKSGLLPNADVEAPNTRCRFRSAYSARSSSLVALASSLQAEEDQLRRLLQEVTGLCTGSENCDVTLRKSGFVGECIRSKAVLVVKTHRVQPSWNKVDWSHEVPEIFDKSSNVPAFDSAVFLLRNPFHAIWEEWIMQQKRSHSPGNVNMAMWEAFVTEQVALWKKTIENWLIYNSDHPVIAVQYELLEMNTRYELLRILEFLGVTYSASVLEGVHWIGRAHGIGKTLFTAGQVDFVNSVIQITHGILSADQRTNYLNIASYYTAPSSL